MHRIGVFDSGIGGLTVLRQLRRAFPQLDMVYLGDTARVPYGGRSVETITHYAEDDVRFLLRKDVEAIVIACGTVSSNSLDALREKFDLPIYGVIESAARLAASMTKTRSVGVIGTQATVKSGAYETHIRAIDPGVHVVSRACPLLCRSWKTASRRTISSRRRSARGIWRPLTARISTRSQWAARITPCTARRSKSGCPACG